MGWVVGVVRLPLNGTAVNRVLPTCCLLLAVFVIPHYSTETLNLPDSLSCPQTLPGSARHSRRGTVKNSRVYYVFKRSQVSGWLTGPLFFQ